MMSCLTVITQRIVKGQLAGPMLSSKIRSCLYRRCHNIWMINPEPPSSITPVFPQIIASVTDMVLAATYHGDRFFQALLGFEESIILHDPHLPQLRSDNRHYYL